MMVQMPQRLINYYRILIFCSGSLNKLKLTIVLALLLGCGPVENENAAYEQLSSADQAKFQKYLLLGKEVYLDNCASCHQENGRGLRGVIPPLAAADYLAQNQDNLPCLLRYTTQDTIMVNGKRYPPQMPAHALTHLELA